MALRRLSTADEILRAGRNLDLRDRSISSNDVSALARLISTSTALEVLSLYNVRLSSDDAVYLARALEFCDTLATLNFTHNPIGEVGTAALAEVIKFNTTLRDVSLANTVLNPQGCALLADALFMNRNLVSLNLEKNRIGAAGAKFLAAALSANQSLRHLSLDGNDVGDEGAISLAGALSPEGGSRLERISLANTGITEVGAAVFGDALVGNLWLQKLVVNKQELQPQILQGMEAGDGSGAGAGDGVSSSSRGLQTIDLSGQALSATLDYPIVCRLAAKNPRLARLRLSRAGLCGVTAAGRGRRSLVGPRSLAVTLKGAPPRLVVLDLSRSFVDDVGVQAICRGGLEHNRVLTNLILSGNSIGGQGVGILAPCLPSSLVDLNLSDNPGMGEKGGSAMGRFLLDFVRSANLRRLDMSSCGLGDAGLRNLAEGVSAAPGLEWLGVAGNLRGITEGEGNGAGRMALGLGLMTCEDSRLQGFTWDRWSVSKGQKELSIVRPKGTTVCQLPSSADVCLLAGVLCSNSWLKRVTLDGNPMDEGGLGYLCRALLRNKSVEFLSLRRCGLGEGAGMLLLRMMAEKPGLEVECGGGNPFGDDVYKQLVAALERARSLLSAKVETRRTTVHLLGEAGVGKTTLKESLGRGYFTSLFQTSKEDAEDRGSGDPSQRTLGIVSSHLTIGSGSARVAVQDHGGLERFRGSNAMDGALACPTAVYVVVISLTAQKPEQRKQIKYWVRVVKAVGPSIGSVMLLVGSRAEQLGSVGQDYLEKLWEQAREELARELLRAGMDASLPTFAGCLAMDCRKANHPNVSRLKDAIAHADRIFGEEGKGWLVSPFYLETAQRIEQWVENGALAVQWRDFVSGVRRQLCPRASEADCVEVARLLHREGRAVVKGLLAHGERERGKGWVTVDPTFFSQRIVGGVLAARGNEARQKRDRDDGVMTAGSVCDAVIGGLGSLPAEDLVRMLLDADVCAVLPEHAGSQVRSDTISSSPPFTATSSGSGGGGERHQETGDPSEEDYPLAVSGVATATTAAGGATAGDDGLDVPHSRTSAERPPMLGGAREDSWRRLRRRRLVFPALLPRSTALGSGSGSESLLMRQCKEVKDGCGGSGERAGVFVAGRRVRCLLAMFLPGQFHMVQARLANRYVGKVRLRYGQAAISLDPSNADGTRTKNSAAAAFSDGDAVKDNRTDTPASGEGSGVEATVELVEMDGPGDEFIDLVVTATSKKEAFLTLLGLRVLVEEVLMQAPAVAVEDMAISGASIRRDVPASDRLVVPLLQVHQAAVEGKTSFCFDDANSSTTPEPLSDLLWDGPEEHQLDDAGRIRLPARFVAPSRALRDDNATDKPAAVATEGGGAAVGTAAAVAGNPFAPGFLSSSKSKDKALPDSITGEDRSFSNRCREGEAGKGGSGGGMRAALPVDGGASVGMTNNPFATAPPAPTQHPPAAAAAAKYTNNPFAQISPAKRNSAAGGDGGDGRSGSEPSGDRQRNGAAGETGNGDGNDGNDRDDNNDSDEDNRRVRDQKHRRRRQQQQQQRQQSCGTPDYGQDMSSMPAAAASSSDDAPGDDLLHSSPSNFQSADLAAGASSSGNSVGSAAVIQGSVATAGKSADGGGGTAAVMVEPAVVRCDDAVFRDSRRMFAAHLGGKSYVFGKQRVEVALRAPTAVRLGIWRPPVDEREEKEREKEKGKSPHVSVEVGASSHDSDNSGSNTNDSGIDDSTGSGERDSPDNSGGSGNGNAASCHGCPASPSDSQHRKKRNAAMATGTTTGTDNAVSCDSPSSPGRDGSGAAAAVTTFGAPAAAVSSTSLSAERPAVLERVCDERVLSDFNAFGSSERFPLVGCVVAAISREPFADTEASPKLLTHQEVAEILSTSEYPLFVQFCRPPLLFTPEPEYPPVNLFSHLVCTNRNLEGSSDGEYRLGTFLSEDQAPRWALATIAAPTRVGDLGTQMRINLADYHVMGLYTLTQEEAMCLLSDHPSRDVFVYVHGFNTPFGFGVRSIAVKARACKKSLGVCLAWPSDPPGEGAGWLIKQVMSTYERRYTYCEHNMHASIFRFLEAALDIKAAADASRITKVMCWKGHSMGCYLLLNIVDRLRWKGEDLRALFGRLILDAPDVPTWFFSSITKVLVDNGVTVCHYFNPDDAAISASCTRRALERPVPGQDAILAHPKMQSVLCSKARSSTGMNHDYGRTDGRCLLDQREFFAGEAPEQRVLEGRTSAQGIPCWQLKTW